MLTTTKTTATVYAIEQTKQRLPNGEVEKTQAAPQKKHRRNGHATLLELENNATEWGIRKSEIERQPQGIKQPGRGPDGEILPLGVTIEVIKQPHQQPHAQQ